MPFQRPRRPQEEQPLAIAGKASELFASPDSEVVESGKPVAEGSPSLELRRQQSDQDGFNFGQTSLFAERSHPAASILLQAKLTVGAPNDKYEQEADHVAEQVVDTINHPATNQSLQRESEESEELHAKPVETAQRNAQTETGIPVSSSLEAGINRAKGGGQSLTPDLQQKMGSAMGSDFSNVKIHTDSHADQLSHSIQAKAFTTGQDVFFRQGEYNPSSQDGQKLIAHELTHVVQQSGGGVGPEKSVARKLQDVIQRDEKDGDNANQAKNNQQQEPEDDPLGPSVQQGNYWLSPLSSSAMANQGTVVRGGESVVDLGAHDKDAQGNKLKRLKWQPAQYPHIRLAQVRQHDQHVYANMSDGGRSFPRGIMEGGVEKGFIFTSEQSEEIKAIHLSTGGEWLTVTPRAGAGGPALAAQNRWSAKEGFANNQVGEHCPQHTGTHFPDTPPGGFHRHFFKAGGMPLEKVDSYLSELYRAGAFNNEPTKRIKTNKQGVPKKPIEQEIVRDQEKDERAKAVIDAVRNRFKTPKAKNPEE